MAVAESWHADLATSSSHIHPRLSVIFILHINNFTLAEGLSPKGESGFVRLATYLLGGWVGPCILMAGWFDVLPTHLSGTVQFNDLLVLLPNLKAALIVKGETIERRAYYPMIG